MAKLPLITVVAPDSGPAKVQAIPKNGGTDPKVYFDTATNTLVTEKLSAPSFSETVDGLVPAPATATGKYLKDDGTWDTPAGGGGGVQSVSAAVGSAITVDNTDADNPIVGLNESAISIASTQVTGLGSLATKSSISNTDVAANAAIDRSKLGTGTAGHVVINDPSTGAFSSEATLAPTRGGTGLGAPAAIDVGKVLTAKADGTYELATKTVGTVTGVSAASGSPITVDNANPATPIIGINQSSISIAQSQVADLTTALSAKAATDYVDSQDAATLASANSYAEGLAYNISSKAPVHVTTTAALPTYTFSGNVLTASVDGTLANTYTDLHTLELNQRVLVKNETGANEKYNGIYYLSQVGSGSAPWKLTRTDDANTAGEICGANVPVETGSTNAGTLWLFSANSSTFVLNTNAVTWSNLTVTVPNASNTVAGKVQLAGAFWNNTANSHTAPSIDLNQTSYFKNTLSRTLVGSGEAYELVFNDSTGALTSLNVGTDGYILKSTATGPAWDSVSTIMSEYAVKTGDTFTGKLLTTATASLAGLNIGSQTIAPTTLVNGDIWYQTNTNTLYARLNGVTQAIIASAPSTNTNIAVASTIGSTGFSFLITGGTSSATSGTGGALTFSAGNASGATSTGGTLTLRAGTGTSTNGSVLLGTTQTASVSIAATGITTTIAGRLGAGSSGVGTAGQFLKSNGASDISWDNIPYDIAGEAVGAISNNDTVMRLFASRTFTLKSSGSGGATYVGARCVTAPTGGSATFDIKENGATVGSITFTAGSNTGTVLIASDVTFVGGTDYLTVECTAANGIVTLWFTLRGTC